MLVNKNKQHKSVNWWW